VGEQEISSPVSKRSPKVLTTVLFEASFICVTMQEGVQEGDLLDGGIIKA
jgi:hypothetical protein